MEEAPPSKRNTQGPLPSQKGESPDEQRGEQGPGLPGGGDGVASTSGLPDAVQKLLDLVSG